MKWGRFAAFIALVLVVVGLTVGTSQQLWKSIRLGLDLQGGFELLYQVEPNTPGGTVSAQGVQAALQAVTTRVNSLGVASPVIQLENKNQIRVDLAGTFSQAQAEAYIGQTADLKIYGKATYNAKTKTWVPDPKTLLITGNDIKPDAAAGQNPNTGQYEVDVTFKNAKRWQQITQQYLGKPLYTFLNGQMITDPAPSEVIYNGQTAISGGDLTTLQACQTLAQELNSGALPYPLKLVSSTSVGPSLGAASLKATMWAGLGAVALIFLFMLLLYRAAGFIADIALVAYAYLLLLTFAGLHVVLTLPGLAALVLGIGMAVDANIITYERIKDELRNGRSLQSSVIAGNKRALRTIIDANATTFIAGAVMYWFGQGDIRGFAVSLMLSIVVSLITAVLLSRAMLLLYTRSNVVKRPWWFGYRARKAVES
ncbi:protein translocase subunit SecD [Alicyclobacillus cycloheptanicus]|uniref:Protein translocase subunit SecD n=1 Tax=Alicyclobacillus cycloheptanicus TaxID=1457 RepID=A0ABT9XEK7_9BACL|nr:protein translocase subunit SecD [Alicyclobacillus cycloheptanicus]MDQ0188729.1 protein-export membrane protein SecD [Alicyclobacillus cycloheptanicus]WDM00607.1 protein translocase subunit SecD [Alicyclobacillus cycloheptanicus]